jgi:hypothetical protein
MIMIKDTKINDCMYICSLVFSFYAFVSPVWEIGKIMIDSKLKREIFDPCSLSYVQVGVSLHGGQPGLGNL